MRERGESPTVRDLIINLESPSNTILCYNGRIWPNNLPEMIYILTRKQ